MIFSITYHLGQRGFDQFAFSPGDCAKKSFLSRGLTRFELGRTERYEGWLVDQFDRVLVTSEDDKHALLSLRTRKKKPGVEVLPNGVDLGYFSPAENGERDDQTVVLSG